MPRPAFTPPDWATNGPYADPGETWHNASRIDRAVLAILAPDGATPKEPTPATAMNALLQDLVRAARYMLLESAGIGVGRYGDGSDGDVVLGAGTTTLTRDMYYNNLTIAAGRTLATAGFRVFVKETFTLDGNVLNDGNSASLGTAGQGAPHRAGVGTLAAFYQGGIDGAAGVTAANTNGISASIGSLLKLGGNGGNGGISGGGESGGGGSVGGTPAVTRGGFRHYPDCLLLRSEIPADAGVVQLIGGGGGGGSGGNDATGGGNTSGAGGGGAGVIGIAARILNIGATGAIRARGGQGGNAVAGSGAGAGGGGGGAGGVIAMIGDVLTNLGAITVPGGVGGSGAIGGGVGTDGGVGTIINLYPD